jgi:glycerophosphoryl diester phosphodiesterase
MNAPPHQTPPHQTSSRRVSNWAAAFAHRGLWSETRAENSASAIKAAHRAGFGVEWDVRLSEDGVPMIFHDVLLQRLTGKPGAFDACTQQALARLRLANGPDAPPTLADGIAHAEGATVLSEIKQSARPMALCRAVVSRIRHHPEILPMSFEPDLVAHMTAALPDRACGLVLHLSKLIGQAEHRDRMRAARAMGARFIACHFTDLDVSAAFAHAHGLGLACWTVRDVATLSRVIAKGAAPIFEGLAPETVKAALAVRPNTAILAP